MSWLGMRCTIWVATRNNGCGYALCVNSCVGIRIDSLPGYTSPEQSQVRLICVHGILFEDFIEAEPLSLARDSFPSYLRRITVTVRSQSGYVSRRLGLQSEYDLAKSSHDCFGVKRG